MLRKFGLEKRKIGRPVIIYVWFNKDDGGDNVGHAAIKTPKYYISLWPAKASAKNTRIEAIFEHRDKIEFHTYEDDLRDEGRPPEFICCLYTLDDEAIDKKYEELFPQIKNWSILGNTKINRPNNHMTVSCSSLVYDLLIAGGIRNLTYVGLTTPMTPSPHNVFTMGRGAKKNELKYHPETQKLDSEAGYKYEAHNEIWTMAIMQGISNSCSIQ